jgi:hypothetical protein
MKIGGVIVDGPSEEVLVLPRPTSPGGDIVIRCRAVLDMTHFHNMCPEPKAKPMLVKGGFKPNEKDPGYLEQSKQYAQLRFAYIALKSLEPSDIEWEKVIMDQPNTWAKWEGELKEAGLSAIEINRVVACIMQANSLDEDKLEKARESFLLGMAEVPTEKSSGQDTEPPSTPSGEDVKE